MTRLSKHLAKHLVTYAALSLCAALPAHAQTGNATTDLLLQAAGQAQQSGALGNLGGHLGGNVAGNSGALGGLAGNLAGNGGALGGLGGLGNMALPSLAGSSAGNVAGLLEYCVRHNYLRKATVENLQTQLLAFAGIPPTQPQQDPGYNQGLSGLLSGNGQGFNLDAIKGQATEKACDHILRSAGSLL